MKIYRDKNDRNNKRAPAKSKRERGASLIEYSLLIILITLLSFTALQVVGGWLYVQFDATANAFAQGGGPW